MNPVFRRTWILVALVVGVAVLDVGAHVQRAASAAPLPAIPAVDPAAVRTLTVTHGDDTVRITRTDTGWALADGVPADVPAVEAVLRTVAKTVPMDVRVGSGEFDTYGLAGADPIRVTVEGESGTLAAFYVGNDAAGGTSFVRFAGADDVYRARLGGRARFDRTPGAWRDHQVLAFDAEHIDHLTIERMTDTLELTRAGGLLDDAGTVRLGRWVDAADPAFPVDDPSVNELVEALSQLRAGEVRPANQPSGTDNPQATVTIHGLDDVTSTLLVGRTEDGTFAAARGKLDVYRVAPGLLDRLVAPRATWRDRTLLAFDPAAARRVRLLGPSPAEVVLDPSGTWKAAPGSPSVDGSDVAALVAALGRMRADTMLDVTDVEGGFPSETALVVELASGETRLELGGPVAEAAADAVYVRSDVSAGVGALSVERWGRIQRLLGR
jgi:hypothetical protein